MEPHLNQDLHIHTIFSNGDSAIVAEQTPELVYRISHARIIGISDHFEYINNEENYNSYCKSLRHYNFKIGTEINGHEFVKMAMTFNFDYYLYHCWDKEADYKAIKFLLNTNKPVIIAHPYACDTNLDKIPRECYLELNNRYLYRYDWFNYLKNYTLEFKFVLGSDAHQPHWLNQNVAIMVAKQLGIKESILF